MFSVPSVKYLYSFFYVGEIRFHSKKCYFEFVGFNKSEILYARIVIIDQMKQEKLDHGEWMFFFFPTKMKKN